MPSLLVCTLLGLATVILVDVLAAPAPRPRVPPPAEVLLIGLARFRRRQEELPRMPRRPRATPTFAWDQADTAGEIEAKTQKELAPPEGPSVIVEE